MLNFIFGRAATGKTYEIMQRLKKDVEDGKDVVLLVPEQFSFESEREVLHTLGDNSSTLVNVLNFTRMCDEVNRLAGGNAFSVMSECDKIITMRTALKAVKDDLVIWKKYYNSPRFAKVMLGTVDELKACSITSEDLFLTKAPSSLGAKLSDLFKIYSTYDALIYNRFIDPADKLTHLFNKLGDFRFFEGKEVYIDAFKEFSGQQFKIIERILQQSNNVTVSLLSNGDFSDSPDNFLCLKKLYFRFIGLAKKLGVKVGENTLLKESRYNSCELANLEKALSGETVTHEEKTNDITLFNASSVYGEAEFVMQTIRRLTREEGYRYRDFVVIARDISSYENAILNAAKKNNVSCYYDKRQPISQNPICIMVLAALRAAQRNSTKEILTYLKTNLGNLNFEEISELENYCFVWNIDGAMWKDVWTMNPNGFEQTANDETLNKQIENINNLRIKALEPLLDLKKTFGGSAKDYCTEIFKLIKKCDCESKLKEYYNLLTLDGAQDNADVLRQGYDCFIGILESIVKCLGDKNLSFDDFYNTLSVAIETSTVGTIPQMLDQVTFGSADRIRPSRPKIAFLLGMNLGVFPATVGQKGIFAQFERKQLLDLGLDLGNDLLGLSAMENLLVYSSACCAADKVFLSYLSGTAAGDNNAPATVIKRIKKAFPNLAEISEKNLGLEMNLPETMKSAIENFALNSDDVRVFEVYSKVAETNNDLKESISRISSLKNETAPALSTEISKKLFGKSISISPSAFEKYKTCPFSFFCNYGLRVSTLKPASFDPLQRGTIVHYVLENYIKNYGAKIFEITEEKCKEIVDLLLKEYFLSVPGFSQVISARNNFLISTIAVSLYTVVWQITCELSQSKFVPKKCEFVIGLEDADIPATDIKFDNDSSVKLRGKIDRVDAYNDFVRIVDYKSDAKVFKLSEVVHGINMQMLIYLYALLKSENPDFNALKPGGVLYMPSSTDLEESSLAMNGLILEDENIVSAMDREMNGQFIPEFKFTKAGKLTKASSYANSETFYVILDYITSLIKKTGLALKNGEISVAPTDSLSHNACDYCDYYGICHIENQPHKKIQKISNEEAIEIMKGEVNNGI